MSKYFEDKEIFKKVISEIELYKESDISLTQTLDNLRIILKTNKVIPIAEIRIPTEEMKEIINEQIKEIELDIKAIRNETIDDFINALEKYEKENWVDFQEYGITFADIEMVAEQLKGDLENEDK